MDDAVAFLDARAQAELVRSGELSRRELVRASVEALQATAPELGRPIVFERFEAALDEAPAADGPFAGVPLLVKDLTLVVRGWPFTAGTRFLKRLGWRSREQSVLADRYRRAGFVLLGQTATSELGGVLTTEPHVFGPTRNPWDPARSPGGGRGSASSTGSAGPRRRS